MGWWVGLGAYARKQLFWTLWSCVGLCGLQMCCFECRQSFFSLSLFSVFK